MTILLDKKNIISICTMTSDDIRLTKYILDKMEKDFTSKITIKEISEILGENLPFTSDEIKTKIIVKTPKIRATYNLFSGVKYSKKYFEYLFNKDLQDYLMDIYKMLEVIE